MKRKLFSVLFAMICALCIFAVAGCGGGDDSGGSQGDNQGGNQGGGLNSHTHSWSDGWDSDSAYHWHNCTDANCPDKNDNTKKNGYGAHVYTNGVCICGKQNSSSVESYSVTFIADKSTVAVLNFTAGDKSIKEPDVPAKKGYNGVWESYVLSNRNISVNAVYTAKTYNVILDGKGGTVNGAQQMSVTYGSAVDGLPVATKSEYIFDGWLHGKTPIEAGDIWDIDEDKPTLSAKWVSTYLQFEQHGNELSVTGITKKDMSVLEIPETFKKIPVTEFNCDFSGFTNLATLTIPDTLKKCDLNLKYSGMPLKYNEYDNGQYLGNEDNPYVLFVRGKLGTASGSLHSDTKIIGERAFSQWNNRLTDVTLPDGVVSIGEYAFVGSKTLKSVTLPESIENIGDEVFFGCDNMQFNSYGNAKYIGSANNPFLALIAPESDTISSCTIHQNTKIIATEAFENCSGLSAIEIPKGVTSIGSNAFWYCGGLTGIAVAGDNPNYASQDGILYNKAKTEILCIPHAVSGSITIPEGVTAIGNGFNSNENLTNISIPNSIKTIAINAFGGCSNLQYNEYEGGLYLGNSANPYVVFMKVKDASVTSCTIPSGTKFIYNSAFDNSSSLNEIYYAGNIAGWCSLEKHNINLSRKVYIGNQKLTEMTDITIPEGVKSIAAYTFIGCSGLTDIEIPDGVTSIGEWAFDACVNLATVSIPSSVTYIGYNAFGSCKGLTSITFNGTMEQWNAIKKSQDWALYTANFTIYCTDGEIQQYKITLFLRTRQTLVAFVGFILYLVKLRIDAEYI